MTLQEFRNQFPARQSTNSGRWGWRRTNNTGRPGDEINLNACRFDTESDALADRDAAIIRGRYDPENGQPV